MGIDVFRNSSKAKMTEYLMQVVQVYPLLFESTIGLSLGGYPCLYLRNKEITQEPFAFVGHSFGYVEVVACGDNNTINIFVYIELLGGTPRGTLTMMNDMELSDRVCIPFFEYDIEIRYTIRKKGKMGIFEYDRDAITRRITIENILKD